TGQISAEKAQNKPEMKPDQPAGVREKSLAERAHERGAQYGTADLAHRELGVMALEYRVDQAEFHDNTATLVHTRHRVAGAAANYKQQITDRQKKLDEAKQKLSDLQDEARKAGAPNSAIE